MSIQKNRLHVCEQRVPAVQMTPSGLDHPYFWIGEEMDCPFEQVFFGNKIGVEDAQKLALRSSESYSKRASLKARPISAMDAMDIKTALTQFFRTLRGDFPRFIR